MSTSKLKLNKEQTKAVEHGDGPLLIIAGAGTGKTTVITERVKYLIAKGKADSSEILALTFTEKASSEMETRIDQVMPYGYIQMWVMTFHSFCDRILRDQALHIGLNPKFRLMTKAESIQLIRKNLFDFNLDYFRPMGNPDKFILGMLQHFSRLTDEDIKPDEYLSWTRKISTAWPVKTPVSEANQLELKKWKELVGAYKKYEELKIENSLMDFGDLISKTLHLFRKRPNILTKYKKIFKYILVDEFQDTNYAQNEIVKLLVNKMGNITAVADDDQSIYRFRGASVSNVVQFRLSFPKTKVVVLNQNYRSSQKILDRSYDLIQHNNPDRLEVVENINKKLMANNKYPTSKVEFIHTGRVEIEANEVVKKIEKLITKENYKYSDFAILVRANNHADPFVKELDHKGIPNQFLGPGKLFQRPEIIELISYLKVLNNLDDSISFYKVLAMDTFKISGFNISKLSVLARKKYISLFEIAEKSKNKKIIKIIKIIKGHQNDLKTQTPGQVLYNFLETTGILKDLLKVAENENKAMNISKFFEKIKTLETENNEILIEEVVDWIDLSLELGESPLVANVDWTEENAVNILTIHSSKGLEFPVVFLVNLVSQRFPSMNRRDQIPIPDDLIKEILPQGDFHIQEERRLFYVGMTRAKEKLYLTASDLYGEGKRAKKISPFVFESLVENVDTKKQKESIFDLTAKKVNKKTKEKKIKNIKIDYLSYSQIETFKVCPLHYKLRYLYKIPTPQSAPASFGISIHETLKDFYKSIKKGGKPNAKIITDLLKANWVRGGFKNKKHEQQFFEKGKVYLSEFLKSGFNKNIIPELLEEKFVLPISEGLRVGGTIDRVDMLPGGELEIIDYKTGVKIPTQKEIDKNLQLSIYALAASQIPTKPFGIIPKKIKLSLYFLSEQKKLTTTRTKKQLETAKKEILKVRDQIENSDFRCSNHYFCQNNCEFSMFCKSEN